MTPTPMSAHIAISSGSSCRRRRLYWFCMDTNRVQPPRSAACWSLANCHAYMDEAPRYRTLPALTTSWSASICLLDRRVRVVTVDLVEVDVVGAKTDQR